MDSWQNTTKGCSSPKCPNRFKDHAWGVIKSSEQGWFHQKDGKSFCSDHTPDWVSKWREKKAEEAARKDRFAK